MTTKQELATTIEKLPYFPYKTLEEFWRAHTAGEVEVTLDRVVARQWASQSQQSPSWLRTFTITLTWLPNPVLFVYIIVTAVNQNWLYLLGALLLAKATDIFNPGSSIRFPILRPCLILLSFLSFLVSIIFGFHALLVLSASLLILWVNVNLVYKVPLRFLWVKGLNNEYVISMLWQGNALSVVYPNGDRYTHRCKVVNGEYTWYS